MEILSKKINGSTVDVRLSSFEVYLLSLSVEHELRKVLYRVFSDSSNTSVLTSCLDTLERLRFEMDTPF